MKQINLFLTEQLVPFTEKSGYRPVLFNTDRNTSESEFFNKVNELKHIYDFNLVPNESYTYKRDSLMEAVINIDSKIYDKLYYNYCIIEIVENDKKEIILYYIDKVKVLQNNANRLFLRMDTISTNFWKIPINIKLGVDRLNYDFTNVDNLYLLRETLKNKDESLGDIIKDRRILVKHDEPLILKPFSIRKFTSNETNLLSNYNFINDRGDDTIITFKSNHDYIKLDDKSHTVIYNYMAPDNIRYFYILYDNKEHKIDRTKLKFDREVGSGLSYEDKREYDYGSRYWPISYSYSTWNVKNSNLYSLTTHFDKELDDFVPLYSELNSKMSKHVVIRIYYEAFCETHDRSELWFYDMPVKNEGIFERTLETIAPIDHVAVKFKTFIEKNFQELFMLRDYISELNIVGQENRLMLYRLNNFVVNQNKFFVPTIFKYIPPISEVSNITLYSWTGKSLPLSAFNFYYFNGKVEINFQDSNLSTSFERKTYIHLTNGLNNVLTSDIDNKHEISNVISIPQRLDSKAEYLSANQNQIEMEKRSLATNAVFGAVNGVLGTASGVARAFAGDMSGAVEATSSTLGIASSLINYSNGLKKIESRINDVGNTRSQYNGGESGDYILLSQKSNTSYFNKNGFNVVYSIPSGELYKKLRYHFKKFGCKLNIYMSLRECFEKTSHEYFSYIRFYDITEFLNNSKIPQEIIENMATLLYSGIHLWPLITNGYPNIPNIEYDDRTHYEITPEKAYDTLGLTYVDGDTYKIGV